MNKIWEVIMYCYNDIKWYRDKIVKYCCYWLFYCQEGEVIYVILIVYKG